METTLPEWFVLALPWFALTALAGLAAIAIGVWVLVRRSQALDRAIARLDALEDLRATLTIATRAVEEIDVRRLEHLLVEVRDADRRLGDAVLDTVERRSAPESQDVELRPASYPLGERVVNRMLALGYRRIQVVDERDGLEKLADGEVRVEAHRDGVLCKGRVLVRAGQITDVDVRTAHSLFP